MARAPQARAPQASAEDDFYEETDGFEAEGADDLGQEGQAGADLSEGAALDTGAEQAAGGEGDLGDGEFIDPAEPPSRGERRFQSLANENRRLADRVAEMERAGRAPAAQLPTGPREETEAEFEARLQLLDGSERADARMARFISQQQRRDFFNTVQAAATADRVAYQEKAQSDPRMTRWKDKVEEEFTKRLNMGQVVSRVDLFYWLVGKHMAENPRVTAKQRDAARQRVDRNTVRPSQGGSDVRPTRRQGDERTQRARRLDGVQI